MLTLIDGNSILFRAYYGVHSRLTRNDGTPTGAAYAFFNMILPVFAAAKSDDIFVCVFDASRQTFRQEIYPEYKANRDATPADLVSQSIMVQRGLNDMGVPVLCIPGVEADDVIATIATQNCIVADKTRIMTGDKDLMQLVSDCIFLYDGMKQKKIERADVIEKFGVPPEQVVDVQSLMGDSSDNVPGVRGIGPKKAAELINEFGSLDKLYENLDKIKNERTRNMLVESRDSAYISRKLVTLKRDVDLSGLKLSPFRFNRNGALNFVRNELESNSLLDKITRSFPETKSDDTAPAFNFPGSVCQMDEQIDLPRPNNKPTKQMTFDKITSVDELEKFLSTVVDIIAIDTETTGLNQMTDKMVGMSLAVNNAHGNAMRNMAAFSLPESFFNTAAFFSRAISVLRQPGLYKAGNLFRVLGCHVPGILQNCLFLLLSEYHYADNCENQHCQGDNSCVCNVAAYRKSVKNILLFRNLCHWLYFGSDWGGCHSCEV